jgi:hypothetical protein
MPPVFVAAPKNNILTANQSSFETDATTGFALSPSVAMTRDITTAKFGLASGKVVTSLAGDRYVDYLGPLAISVYATYPVEPLKTYTVSAYIKTDGVASAAVRLIFIDANGGVIMDTVGPLVTNTDWLGRAVVTSQAPYNTRGALIRTQHSTVGTTWVDGVMFGPSASAWVEGQSSTVTQPNPFANPLPLFTDAGWVKHANTTVSPDGTTLTLVATAGFQGSFYDTPATPSTQYAYSGNVTVNNGAIVYFNLTYFDANNIVVGSIDGTYNVGPITIPLSVTQAFVTPPRTSKVRITCNSNTICTCTFANVTLRPTQPTFVGANALEFFKEQVINGDFSNGATGWALHANASVIAGVLTLVATGGSQSSFQDVPVAPNTTYRLTLDVTASGGIAQVDLNWGAIASGVAKQLRSDALLNLTVGNNVISVTTLAGQTKLTIGLVNSAAGTFTFDNISLKRASPP